VLGFLAATYVVWGAGLWLNLMANWRLLEETGTSTNALSKGLFDLARLRSGNQRTVRAASAAGYVVVEIAKEAPYYAGAFGTALLSDAVDSTDALVFLGGANLGAAVYEYGVSRLTRTILDARSRRIARPGPPVDPPPAPYAAFDTDWVPREYLSDYYRVVEADERVTIAFFVDALRHAEPGQRVLLFGVGPTLHHVFLTAGMAEEVHLAEYLPANLHEIERWLAGGPDAHDWRPFVRYTLECEGVAGPTDEQIRDREQLVRSKVTALLGGDAGDADPLGGRGSAPYGVVISAYCADSATADKPTWESYMRNIAGLVRPGGLFITAALRHSTGYVVGGKMFPSASVDEADIRRVLEPCFDWDDGVIEVGDLSADRTHGYTSIVLARVRKRSATCRLGAPLLGC
jgi:NNMT/PNMT/TEMT family